MRKNNGIVRTILGLVVLAAVATLLYVRQGKAARHRDRSLKIDNTELIVNEIRQISKLVTACWYEDVVMSDSKPSRYFGTDDLCIIVKGNLRAGYDFSKFSADDISVSGDTLRVRLPEAQILDVIVNPSGTEIYDESGSWSHDEIRALTNKAGARLINDASNAGILQKARSSAETQLEELFRSFGFPGVVFENKD